MKNFKKQLLIFTVMISSLFSSQFMFSQDKTAMDTKDVINAKKKSPLDFSVSIRTGYMWRGFILTDIPMAAVYANYKLTKRGDFSFGFWGALPFGGYENDDYYRDYNFYIQYANKGLSIGVWDLYNTLDVGNVPNLDFNNDFFDYGDKTNHLIDFRSSYTFPSKVYLELDVMLYGAKDAVDGKQNLSSYFQIGFPLIQNKEVNLDGFIGTGFALGGETHLYGNGENKFDLVNIGFSASKKVQLLGKNLPVNANIKWNPSKKITRIEFVATLF